MRTLKCGLIIASLLAANISCAVTQVNTNPNRYTHLQGLNKTILHVALRGYNYATKHAHVKRKMLGIVDFTQSSIQKRLYIVDLVNRKVIARFRVAHGANSGALYARNFSNDPGSHMSSLGVFITGKTYRGEYGYALRLNGLEAGLNDNAAKRDVVMHGEWFLEPKVVDAHHEAGKSYGCFVVDPAKVTTVINYLKNGGVIFSYAQQEDYDPHFMEH